MDNQVKDLTGRVFSRLTVLNREGSRDGALWRVRCVCGEEKVMLGYNITSGRAKSCGCLAREQTSVRAKAQKGSSHPSWRGEGELSGWYFASLRLGAERRGIAFEVSKPCLWGKFQAQSGRCALSGVALAMGETASVDRIDPQLGYVSGNVQWVHKDLNEMKKRFPQAKFIHWCKLVAENAGGHQ